MQLDLLLDDIIDHINGGQFHATPDLSQRSERRHYHYDYGVVLNCKIFNAPFMRPRAFVGLDFGG